MWVAVDDRLQPVEEPVVLQVLDHGLRAVADVAAGQEAEPLDERSTLVERRQHGQPERLSEREVLRPAARRDMDDPRPLVLADLVPGDHDVLVGRPGHGTGREARPDGRQLVERTPVAPADELGARPIVEHLERPHERLLDGPPAQPEGAVPLAHLHVAQPGPDRSRHVRRERPGCRGPDQERLAGAVQQREPDGQAGVRAVRVSLGHLVLADPGPAAGAPRHRVVALVEPAPPVALGQESPDQVVVLVAEREVRAAELGHPKPADEHLHPVGDRPARPGQGGLGGRVGAQQVAQAAQLIRVVPVHPVTEPDRLLRLARRKRQHALLAEADELGDPVLLDVPFRGEAQVALHVDLDPQALAVEAVLPALILAAHGVEALEDILVGPTPGVVDTHRVVGRDGTVEEAPARPSRVLGTQAGKRPAFAPEREDLVLLGDQVGLAGDGCEHLTSDAGWI